MSLGSRRLAAASAGALLLASQAFAQNVARIPARPAPAPGLSAAVSPYAAGVQASLLVRPLLPVPFLTATLMAPTAVLMPAAAIAERAGGSAVRGRVAAAVFDLDGNVFGPGLPTKIILFRKGGLEELPVSTADYALIEKKIGTDCAYGGVNLRNYEIRREGSFRNFSGPQFLADLRFAVENLPESAWQGPSWPALVRALGDAGTALHVYVITARAHTPEELLDGFRYLQSRGYLRHLPKAANLHGVGASVDVPGRKTEVMADILDALQAAAFGTVGFSDDTWTTFETMRAALTRSIQAEPGRWKNIKIVLFFTGTNDPEHSPSAIVLRG